MCLTSPEAGRGYVSPSIPGDSNGSGAGHALVISIQLNSQCPERALVAKLLVEKGHWMWTCLTAWELFQKVGTGQWCVRELLTVQDDEQRSWSWSPMQKTAWLGDVQMDEPPFQ